MTHSPSPHGPQNCSVLTEVNFADSLLADIRAAKHTIRVAMYMASVSNNEHDTPIGRITRAMCEAAARDVRCSIILPRHDSRYGVAGYNENAAALFAAHGWIVRTISPLRTMHSKLWIFDSNTTTIGSHNLSAASIGTNLDTSLRIECARTSARMAQRFHDIWNQSVALDSTSANHV